MMVEVRQISYEETKPFLLGIHYARRMPCISYAFGLFVDTVLVGVITYGQPASPSLCKGVAGEENRQNVLELNRLAIKPEFNGSNYASMLVSKSLKLLPGGKIIVSYADAGGWGHVGYIYQATNFLYTGMTTKRTDKYGGEHQHSRHYEKGEMRRCIRTAKHRYITFTGSKSQKRKLRKQLKYEVLDYYPKGDSIHYEVNNPQPVEKELYKVIGDNNQEHNNIMKKSILW